MTNLLESRRRMGVGWHDLGCNCPLCKKHKKDCGVIRIQTEELDEVGDKLAEKDRRIEELERSRDFYKIRAELLQSVQSKMRDPERVMVCDILANGSLSVEPGRYALDEKDKRIEELERKASVAGVLPMDTKGIYVTLDQIAKAWEQHGDGYSRELEAGLECLNIHRCEGCGGSGIVEGGQSQFASTSRCHGPCAKWGSHGFVIGEKV